MRLESAAASYGPAIALSGGWSIDDGQLDLAPLLDRLADESNPQRGAAQFHATLLVALDEWIGMAARETGVRTVALSGGCMLNRILARDLPRRLSTRGLKVLTARQAPPNDGGVALGQAWVAIRQLTKGS